MKKLNLKIFFLLTFCAVLFQSTPLARAAAIDDAMEKILNIAEKTGLPTESSEESFYDKLAGVINIVLGFVGVIAFIFIIYSGFKWMTAAGNETQVRDAKSIIKASIVGLLIIMTSYVFVNYIVEKILNIFSKT